MHAKSYTVILQSRKSSTKWLFLIVFQASKTKLPEIQLLKGCGQPNLPSFSTTFSGNLFLNAMSVKYFFEDRTFFYTINRHPYMYQP